MLIGGFFGWCVRIETSGIWDTGAMEDAPGGDDAVGADDGADDNTTPDIDPFCRTRSCFDTDTEAGCVGDCVWDTENDMCNDDFAGLPDGSGGSGDLTGGTLG